MRKHLKVFAGVAAMTLAGSGAWAEQDQPPRASAEPGQEQQAGEAGSQQQGRQRQQQPQAPEGFVLIQERVVYLMGNAPQQHLLASLEKMHQNNPSAAAGEIRQAAAYVEMQASRAKGDGARALDRAAGQLNQLAEQVGQEDAKVSPEELTRAFAQTGHALARHHHVLAQRALEKDRHLQAGYELEATAQALKQAIIWSGRQPEQEMVGALQNALAAAYELRNEKFPADGQRQARQSQQQKEQSEAEPSQEPGEAQPASARERAAATPGDPRTGTTRAEAQNIEEHANTVLEGLDKDIQELGSKLRQAGGSDDGSQSDEPRPDRSGEQTPEEQQEQKRSSNPSEQEPPQL